MAVCVLLYPQDPAFEFFHDQMHRAMASAAPNTTYPAFGFPLDPMQGADVPAGQWNTAHAQAHADFARAFPAIQSASSVALNDVDLNTGATNWWGLSNKTLHDLANSVLPRS